MKRSGKRSISLVLVIAMILSMAFPVFAGNAAVEFAFTSGEAVPGEELSITLSVASESTVVDGLIAYGLSYDNTVATFVGFDSYGTLVTNSVAGETSVNNSQKIINLGYSPAIVPNGNICVLKFQISENAVPGSEFTVSMSASASKDRQPVSGGIVAPSCTVKVKQAVEEVAVKYSFEAQESAEPGEEIAVELNVESASTLVDGLIVYGLSYDNSLAEFNGFDSYGELVTSSLTGTTSVNNSSKTINLGYSPAIVPNGTICILKFKIKADAEPGSELTISMSASASKNRQPVSGIVVAPTCKINIKEPVVKETRRITISNFKGYTVSINGHEDSYTSELIDEIAFDSHVIVTAVDTTDFAYWRNSANVIVSRTPVLDFYVAVAETYTAVYNTKAPNKVTVIFESPFSQVMKRVQVTAEGAEALNLPPVPVRYGYVPVGWEYDNAQLKALAEEKLSTEDTSDDVIVVKAVYTKKDDVWVIEVNGGTGSGEYADEEYVTAVANEPASGLKFSHWENSDGSILSYRSSYKFYAMCDMTISAVYVSESVDVARAGVASIIKINKDTENRTISFASFANVPDDFILKQAGIVATSDNTVGTDPDRFNIGTAAFNRYQAATSTILRYLWTKTNVGSETWYVRAYLVYTDDQGNTITAYSDIVSANLNQ